MTAATYRKTLTYAPALDTPVNVYERCRRKLEATMIDGLLQPFELTYLAGQIACLLERRSGRRLAFKDIQRLLRQAADFRGRFWNVMDRANWSVAKLEHPPRSAVAIVVPYMNLCHEEFDAHIQALRHLWFGPTGDVRVDDDWYFGIPGRERRRFLAGQYAVAALLYVDAAQLAAVMHRKGVDTANYALRAARAMRRAIEFDSLNTDQLRAEMAREAAMKRHRTSPKAAARDAVYSRWKNWTANRESHPSNARFALAMVKAYPEIESPQTVERWVRAWRKGKGPPRSE